MTDALSDGIVNQFPVMFGTTHFTHSKLFYPPDRYSDNSGPGSVEGE